MSILLAKKAVPADVERTIVINDIKLFAQADVEKEIDGYLTSDSRNIKLYSAVRQTSELSFKFLDIKTPCHEAFGFLPLS